MKNKFNKKIICLLLVILSLLSYANNCIAAEWYDNIVTWYEDCRGARISVWNIEKQEKIKSFDILDKPNDFVSTYRKVSDYTKPEIIDLNFVIPQEIVDNLTNDRFITTNLCKNPINLPEFFSRDKLTDEERYKSIGMWFGNKDNLENLFDSLEFTNDERLDWNNKKLCLLIEPLIVIHTIFPKKDMWAVTTAELGILAYNGFSTEGQIFESYGLAKTAFKAMPFGIFKTGEGYLKKIGSFTETRKWTLISKDDYKMMVNVLGSLEINVDGAIKVDAVEEIVEPETEPIILNSTESSNVTVKVDENNVDIQKIIKEIPWPILICLLIILILLLSILNATKKNNIIKNDANGNVKNCNMIECRYNNKGKCTSDVVNKKHDQCNEDDDFYYFEEKN